MSTEIAPAYQLSIQEQNVSKHWNYHITELPKANNFPINIYYYVPLKNALSITNINLIFSRFHSIIPSNLLKTSFNQYEPEFNNY